MTDDNLITSIAKLPLAAGPLGSAIWAYATTPALTGLKGIFGAAMIGAGTGMITTLQGLTGMAVGAALGSAVNIVKQNPSYAPYTGAMAGLFLGALTGIPHGHSLTKDIIVNGIAGSEVTAAYNEAAAEDHGIITTANGQSFTTEKPAAIAKPALSMAPL